MSIRNRLTQLLDSEVLLVPSAFLGEETPRCVYAVREVADLVLGEWDQSREGQRHAAARAVLDHFSDGGFVTIAGDPFRKDALAILALVVPVEFEIWDFRCLYPGPGTRILGCFLATSEFIALAWDYRENFDDEGGWSKRIKECRLAWKRLFGELSPHTGDELDAYVDFNCRSV